MSSTFDYYREDHSTLLHSPHSHSPVSSPHIIKSQFDPYPSQLSQASYPVSPSAGRSAYPTLEMPTPYHSDNHEGGHGHPSTPPRVSTPSQSGNYYAYDHSHSGGRASTSDAVDPAFIRQVTPDPRHLSVTPEPHSPQRGGVQAYSSATLKVIQWTPQHGEEGTQVTIILDALAVRGAARTAASVPIFGPGSPALGTPRRSPMSSSVTRRFAVIFGIASAPTKFTRANTIDGNGVGASMTSGPGEDDAFVILTTFVPARQTMGPLGERVMVIVQVLDEVSRILEECVVGEWDAQHPSTPPRLGMKRHGEELINDRASPAIRSPALSHHGSPLIGGGHNAGWLSPAAVSHQLSPSVSHQLLSPRVGGRSTTPADGEKLSTSASLRHPPIENPGGAVQPDLLRTSQIPSHPQPSPFGGSYATYSNKALLKLQGDLNQMAMGWSNEEWTNRRRLIQFWRQQEGNVINATFRPIAQSEFVPNSIVISCIFRDEWNECFVTSVDTIYLLEALVGVRFTVEEKNRIRRNLEGFKPMTVSKSKQDSEPFFKLIMGFPNPKPRNIEKDVKVFPWKILSNALKKIISKYSATYSAPVDGNPSTQLGDDSGAGHVLASPLSVQGERFSAPRSPSLNPSAPNDPYGSGEEAQSPTLPSEFASGSRPDRASFDFGSILDTSNFADPSGESGASGSSSATPANGAAGGTHGAYAAGPPDALSGSGYSTTNLFPSAEDYGVVGGERLAPPAPMVHSRSYSETPQNRKSISGPGQMYGAGSTVEYAPGSEFGYTDDA